MHPRAGIERLGRYCREHSGAHEETTVRRGGKSMEAVRERRGRPQDAKSAAVLMWAGRVAQNLAAVRTEAKTMKNGLRAPMHMDSGKAVDRERRCRALCMAVVLWSSGVWGAPVPMAVPGGEDEQKSVGGRAEATAATRAMGNTQIGDSESATKVLIMRDERIKAAPATRRSSTGVVRDRYQGVGEAKHMGDIAEAECIRAACSGLVFDDAERAGGSDARAVLVPWEEGEALKYQRSFAENKEIKTDFGRRKVANGRA
ncbi:hypothetical protein B0H13DRAFT_1906513 [Mycena leptocephala]|nr:hypothetical protein B0H13DRAFT_1906513 [Mycena leptocephala]